MKYDYNINLDADTSLSYIINRIAPHSNVLEFGPAKGYMTRILTEQKNCSVSCVEIDADAARLTEPLTSRMFVGDLDEMLWIEELMKGAPYDYVVFADVLEHLKQPEAVLKAAIKMLKDDGEVLTSIPNMAHAAVVLELLRGNFEYRSLGLLDNTHLKFYTKRSIERLLEQSGLTAVAWMTTRVLPDQTEIKTSYYDVPSSVAEFIKENPESHVYQYITVSQKIKLPTTNNISEVTNGEYLYTSFAQIFLDKPYNERSSIKLGIESPWGDQVLKVHIPCVYSGQVIRIDPTNFPALISVKKICFLSLRRELILEWSKTEIHSKLASLYQLHHLSGELSSTDSLWIAVGDDPQWEISLPIIVQDCILELHLSTLSSQNNLLNNLYQYIKCSVNSKQMLEENLIKEKIEINKLTTGYDSLMEAQHALKEELHRQKEESNKFRDELKSLENKKKMLENELANVKNSRTWKWTRWIRNIKGDVQ
ncbi:class I SAM-dependent methyltransferase [Cohnella sp. GCM10020058]|uniref:class I SAM-dependent methyltransferase n=1 Tax=Cohnella sp. GCM10020058 TaxID=3317330 RepID=UPI00363776F1